MVLTSKIKKVERDEVYAYISNPVVTTCTDADVYYFIEGTFVNEVLECWNIVPPLTYLGYCGTSNVFKIHLNASLTFNTASNLIHLSLFKNNILQTNSIMGIYIKNTSEEYTCSLVDVLTFNPGDFVDIRLKASQAGSEVIAEHITTSLNRFF